MNDLTRYVLLSIENGRPSKPQLIASHEIAIAVRQTRIPYIACERCGCMMTATWSADEKIVVRHPDTHRCSWFMPGIPMSRKKILPNVFLDATNPDLCRSGATLLRELHRFCDDRPKVVFAVQNLRTLVDCYRNSSTSQLKRGFLASMSSADSLGTLFRELTTARPVKGDRRVFHGIAKEAYLQGDDLIIRMEGCKGLGARLEVYSHIGDLVRPQVLSLVETILSPHSRIYAFGDGESCRSYGTYVRVPSHHYLYVASDTIA